MQLELTLTLNLCFYQPVFFFLPFSQIFCFSLRCGYSIITLSIRPAARDTRYSSAAVLNVAPRAPYQSHVKNSGEQLNADFNSSLTTEVKTIAQCFQMDVASKELFSYHKLSADLECIPKLTLRRCGTVGTFDKHIYPASQTRPLWNSKSFLRHVFIIIIAGIDS